MKPRKEDSAKMQTKINQVTTKKDKWILRLYVAGQTPKAITELQI